ncbi:MAG: hypothetical protein M5U28_04905 [Sandaracinaceae bacterium]|nr:hypothetical protein [Sandaracinaceae bacterium]
MLGDASTDAGPLSPPARTETDYSADACFNGVDDDQDELTDCADSTCSATPFCCLGLTTAACCAPGSPLTASFASCADPSCGVATLFGDPAPTVEGDALVPNGSPITDAGLVLGGPIDGTRERITLAAAIAAPIDSCTECLDAVALGVGDALEGDVVSVRPDAAVIVRASRRDFALVVAGEVVESAELADGDPHVYTLSLSPDGTVSLDVDGTERDDRGVDAARRSTRAALRAIAEPLFAPPADGARALGHGADRGLRDPSSLARDEAPVLPPWSPLGSRAPTAVVDGAGLLVAFELAGAIHLARQAADGTWTLAGSGNIDTPVLSPPSGEAYRDPELVREAERWVLYLTHERGSTRSIARASGEDGHAERFDAPVPLSVEGLPTLSLSAPAVATFGGRTLLSAVAEQSGSTSIYLFEVVGDALLLPSGDISSGAVVRARGGVSAFDADEVGGPALHVDGAGILRLYYAGRRGSRWAIGVLASGDGSVFLYAPGEPVLRPLGRGPRRARRARSERGQGRRSPAGVPHRDRRGERRASRAPVGGTRW